MEFIIQKDTPVIPHKKHWQFCVGSGHALLALRTDYTRQLKFIHDTLGIERVRFHGIFDDDMRTYTDLSMQLPLPGAEAFEEYNFNACGVAYNKREMNELIEKSAVIDEPWQFTYKDGILTITAELGVNDVYFFTVK